jgi:D-cysteine desulfhydrase
MPTIERPRFERVCAMNSGDSTLELRLGRHPRAKLVAGPTPLQRIRRIEATFGGALNGTRLYVKRDDLTGLGGGGSKLRKLEFLFGEALANGADTVFASGLLQSNSARLAAAAAASLGLHCELALRPLVDDADYQTSGNMFLDGLFGAPVRVLPDAAAVATHFAQRAEALATEGRKTYTLPPGASSAVASLGYVAAAAEIVSQEQSCGVRFDRIVLANGSSASHAGLVAGFALLGRHRPVHGVAVFANRDATHALTLAMARGAIELLGADAAVDDRDVLVNDEQLGAGYGRPTPEAIAAIRLLSAQEGLLLDPVYSGKAFAGLLAQARRGDFQAGENVLFIMTGGASTLFAYRAAFS